MASSLLAFLSFFVLSVLQFRYIKLANETFFRACVQAVLTASRVSWWTNQPQRRFSYCCDAISCQVINNREADLRWCIVVVELDNIILVKKKRINIALIREYAILAFSWRGVLFQGRTQKFKLSKNSGSFLMHPKRVSEIALWDCFFSFVNNLLNIQGGTTHTIFGSWLLVLELRYIYGNLIVRFPLKYENIGDLIKKFQDISNAPLR